MIESGAFGRKAFLLHPPPVILEVIEELAKQEFEVYTAKDHVRLANALPRFPDSILFINLDAGLEEPAWAAFVVEHDGLRLNGELSDLSVVGMLMRMPGVDALKVGTVLDAMTITLRGVRVSAVGFIAARREAPVGPSYVVMFDPASIDEAKSDKLRKQIFRINQHSMDRLLEQG